MIPQNTTFNKITNRENLLMYRLQRVEDVNKKETCLMCSSCNLLVAGFVTSANRSLKS